MTPVETSTIPASALSGAATRRDDLLGTVETAGFLPTPDGRLFAVTHRPVGAPRPPTVVICPSILQDFLQNYRREVVLARRLAAAGIPTVRFHYRGAGHSTGDGDHVTFDQLVEDTVRVTRALALPTDALAFVGPRFGAYVAAAAADALGGAAVLWDPPATARAYYREAFRAVRVRDLKEGTAELPPSDALARDGQLDVLGCRLGAELHASSAELRLAADVGAAADRVLVTQVAPTDELRPDLAATAAAWRERGVPVTTRAFRTDQAEPWWFLDTRPDDNEDLIAETHAWLEGGVDEERR